MELSHEQYDTLISNIESLRADIRLIDQRLTAQEGLNTMHHKILVIGNNGTPAVPEQMRIIGSQVEEVKKDVEAVDGKIVAFISAAEENDDKKAGKWWQVIMLFLSVLAAQLLGPLLRSWLNIP